MVTLVQLSDFKLTTVMITHLHFALASIDEVHWRFSTFFKCIVLLNDFIIGWFEVNTEADEEDVEEKVCILLSFVLRSRTRAV